MTPWFASSVCVCLLHLLFFSHRQGARAQVVECAALNGNSGTCTPSAFASASLGCYCVATAYVPCPSCPVGQGRHNCGCIPNNADNSYACGPGECRDCAPLYAYALSQIGSAVCAPCTAYNLNNSFYITQPCDGVHNLQVSPCVGGMECTAGVGVTCPVGYYCKGGSARAQLCEPLRGEQCNATGLVAPHYFCAPGRYLTHASAGSGYTYDCTPCGTGQTSYPPSLVCTDCAAGSAVDPATGVCTPCAAGSFQSQALQTSCVACPAGFYQSREGQTACVGCPPGSHLPYAGGSVGCVRCDAGTFEPLSNSSAAACAQCPPSTYAGNGASACTACPAGTMTVTAGAIDVSFCGYCGAGHAVVGSLCVVCLPFQVADPSTWYYCPGDGTRYPMQQLPRLGQTYVIVAGNGLADNVLAPCVTCPDGQSYLSEPCSLTSGGKCRACSTAQAPYTYVSVPCGATFDARILPCQSADQLPDGGRCNPCPPGSFLLSSGHCAACPASTYAGASGSTQCTPCPPGTGSDGGASFCARLCVGGGQSFSPDGVGPCVASTDQLPWRTLIGAAPAPAQALAQLPDGTLFATSRGGLLWRVEAAQAWLIADGLGQAPLSSLIAVSNNMLVAVGSGRVWRITYVRDGESLVRPLVISVVDNNNNMAMMLQPVAAAVVFIDGVTALLIADWVAHCVWGVYEDDTAVVVGGTYGVQAPSLGMTPNTALLANPSLVAMLPDVGYYVVDARGVWGTTANDVLQLSYVCGGGLRALSTQPMLCTDLSVSASGGFASLAATRAGQNEPALFFLTNNNGGAVWMLALNAAPATIRPLLLPASDAQTMPTTLAWTGQYLLLGDSARQIRAGGIGALAQLAPLPTLHCLCAQGLYCNTTRQQCMPAPAGSIAPPWVNAPQPCPPGSIAVTSTACAPCPLPNAFTTYDAGSLQCVRRCAAGQIFHEGVCVAGCNSTRGEFEQVISRRCLECWVCASARAARPRETPPERGAPPARAVGSFARFQRATTSPPDAADTCRPLSHT